MTATTKGILSVFNKWMESIRKADQKIHKKSFGNLDNWNDPFANVKILPNKNMDYREGKYGWMGYEEDADEDLNGHCVLVRFDGDAWEYLSYNGSLLFMRNKLEEKLKKIGTRIENMDSCAILMFAD